MKIILITLIVIMSQSVFARELVCASRDITFQGQFDGVRKVITGITLEVVNESGLFYPLAVYDPSYRPRNTTDMVRYNIMKSHTMRAGFALLLPRVKGSGVFKGILVGRTTQYHGEPDYEFLRCRLN